MSSSNGEPRNDRGIRTHLMTDPKTGRAVELTLSGPPPTGGRLSELFAELDSCMLATLVERIYKSASPADKDWLRWMTERDLTDREWRSLTQILNRE